MSLLQQRQIERLETAIEVSTDWLEIQYLKREVEAILEEVDLPSESLRMLMNIGV